MILRPKTQINDSAQCSNFLGENVFLRLFGPKTWIPQFFFPDHFTAWGRDFRTQLQDGAQNYHDHGNGNSNDNSHGDGHSNDNGWI